MNADYYAIVVGLDRYPVFGEPSEPTADLNGPGNDADAIVEWLTSAGGLPPANVAVIKSPDPSVPPPANAKPTSEEITQAFIQFSEMARRNRERGDGGRIGRRLYLYMSGHGFSPRRNHGCLFSGNATVIASWHVYPSFWLEWFQEAACFDELVLWMDCCMNRNSTLPPSLPPVAAVTDPSSPAGPTFIAFAAQRPLKAVEKAIPEDGNKVHGIFTWTLLEGLKGAAANEYGMVTGRSLADWMRNAQKSRMDKADIEDPDVADEPEIAREDSNIVFGRGIAPKMYPVRFSFPQRAEGRVMRLWSGRPPRAEEIKAPGQTKQLSLRPGLYVVDVPGSNLRQGFEVAGPTNVAVAGQGCAVKPGSAEIFEVQINPQAGPSENFVIDERFGLVDRNAGMLISRLPFGIYKLKTRVGRTVEEQIILLDANWAPPARQIPVASAAPLPNTSLTHEYHVRAAERSAAKVHVRRGEGARLSIMTRAWSETGQTQSEVMPWAGVKVVNARGTVIANLDEDGERETQGDPISFCSLSVDPGTYYLRHPTGTGGSEIEQSLIVPQGWFLQGYLLRVANPDGKGFKPAPRLSFLMHRASQRNVLSDQLFTTLETARVALADERRILSDELETLLLSKTVNPIAGIIGGHLLIIDRERGPTRDLRLLNEVVRNLRRLVGDEHPDVEALSLRCPDQSLRRVRPMRTPPMFLRSWMLLLEGSQERSSLLPRTLWNRVQAHATLPPYFIWAADDEAKELVRDALVDSVVGMALPAAAAAVHLAAESMLAPRALARPAAIPRLRTLSADMVTRVMKSAQRLQVPPSALRDIKAGVINKLKG